MITPTRAADLVGAPVHLQRGGRFATIRRDLLDDGSGWPSWALVDPGLLRSSHLPPLSVCYVDEDGVSRSAGPPSRPTSGSIVHDAAQATSWAGTG